jgi:hypothetical protein
MFDGTSGMLPPGEHLTVELGVVLQSTSSGINVTNQATASGFDVNGILVGDLSDAGLSPNTNNSSGDYSDPTATSITFFAFDTFNNFANGFGSESVAIGHFAPRPLLDTFYTGISTPGATLNLRVYDQSGLEIGNRSVTADAAGNWLAQFPNATVHTTDLHYGTRHFGSSFDGSAARASSQFGARGQRVFSSIPDAFSTRFDARSLTSSTIGHHLYHLPGTQIDGQPHRVEISTTPAIYNSPLGSVGSAQADQRYFQPAVHPTNYFFQATTAEQVFANAPGNALKSGHQSNLRPLGFGLNANGLESRTLSVSW